MGSARIRREDRYVEYLDEKLTGLATGNGANPIRLSADKKCNSPESPSISDRDNEEWITSIEKPEQMEYLSDQQSEEGAWIMTKNRKDAKKQKASDQVRRSTRNKKTVVPKEQLAPGGLSGVNQTIGERLAQIGLKHAPVSQGGNCAYLATSQAVYGSSSKWQTVRNLRARHLEGNKEHYIGGLTSEML